MTFDGKATRLERARSVRDRVLEAGKALGRWESVDLPGGAKARIWVVDGEGWTASVTTRFSGVPSDAPGDGHNRSVRPQPATPRASDVLLDVFHHTAGKVLSLSTTDGVDKLIGMQPGPWEALFDLPAQPWSPAFGRRLDKRSRGGQGSAAAVDRPA